MFKFKYNHTGMFMQQITPKGQTIFLNEHKVKYVNLDNKVEKDIPLNFNHDSKDHKPDADMKVMNALMRTDLEHMLVQYHAKKLDCHYYWYKEDKKEFQMDRNDLSEELRTIYLFERLEGQNYEYVERCGCN